MIKYFILLLLIAFMSFFNLTVASPFTKDVTYEGRKLVKKFENGAMAEYIPQNESLDNWTKMFAVRVHGSATSAEKTINQIKEAITSGKASQAKVIQSYSNSEKNIHVIVFTLGDQNILEYNVLRYIELEPGKIISFQLAKRFYKSNNFNEE